LAAERNVDLDLLPIMATQAPKPLNTQKKCGSRPVDQKRPARKPLTPYTEETTRQDKNDS
jgi:hypothetical protein